jgi:hypothetical protein
MPLVAAMEQGTLIYLLLWLMDPAVVELTLRFMRTAIPCLIGPRLFGLSGSQGPCLKNSCSMLVMLLELVKTIGLKYVVQLPGS